MKHVGQRLILYQTELIEKLIPNPMHFEIQVAGTADPDAPEKLFLAARKCSLQRGGAKDLESSVPPKT